MKEIKFKDPGQYLGRNRHGKCCGLRFFTYNTTDPNRLTVRVTPVNTIGEAPCFIDIPSENVMEVTRALEDFLPVPELMKGMARAVTIHDAPCTHNEMVETGDAEHAWKCAKCGYVYGEFDEEYCLMDPASNCAECKSCTGHL